jgi:hypothetical protein
MPDSADPSRSDVAAEGCRKLEKRRGRQIGQQQIGPYPPQRGMGEPRGSHHAETRRHAVFLGVCGGDGNGLGIRIRRDHSRSKHLGDRNGEDTGPGASARYPVPIGKLLDAQSPKLLRVRRGPDQPGQLFAGRLFSVMRRHLDAAAATLEQGHAITAEAPADSSAAAAVCRCRRNFDGGEINDAGASGIGAPAGAASRASKSSSRLRYS